MIYTWYILWYLRYNQDVIHFKPKNVIFHWRLFISTVLKRFLCNKILFLINILWLKVSVIYAICYISTWKRQEATTYFSGSDRQSYYMSWWITFPSTWTHAVMEKSSSGFLRPINIIYNTFIIIQGSENIFFWFIEANCSRSSLDYGHNSHQH